MCDPIPHSSNFIENVTSHYSHPVVKMRPHPVAHPHQALIKRHTTPPPRGGQFLDWESMNVEVRFECLRQN